MVVIPAGSFTMGSPAKEEGRYDDEGPQHVVRIARPFAVGKFSVTVDEFKAFVTATGYDAGSSCYSWTGTEWKTTDGRSWRDPGFRQTGSHPAACLNWNDAQAYVAWLKKKTGKNYRLLSEAEWEYAARGGTTTPFWWGSSISTAQANYDGNYTYTGGKKGEYRAKTVPVDSFAPNSFGLYNVHGNVWQWVEDCYPAKYDGAPADGSAWTTGDCNRRVIRGGSWDVEPGVLRAANRSGVDPDVRGSFTGFRLARTLTP
jgi:formylglycine-generating enzyme required for sulfatase activity